MKDLSFNTSKKVVHIPHAIPFEWVVPSVHRIDVNHSERGLNQMRVILATTTRFLSFLLALAMASTLDFELVCVYYSNMVAAYNILATFTHFWFFFTKEFV